jgi:4-amino-4-deoxy-L-arabinose transferase-like glycosyltransferase
VRGPDRWSAIALGAILLLALGLRLGHAIPGSDDPVPDARGYARIAESLYEDGRFGQRGDFGEREVQEPSNYSPGTPLFVTGVYAVTGGVHPQAGRIAIALVGSLAVFLAYLLGRRLAGPVAGVAGALLTAVYPPLLEYNGMFMSELLAGATLTGSVLAMLRASERGGVWAWALPGLLLGLTALIRPEYLIFGPVFALLALYKAGRWRPGLLAAAALLAAFALPILPWTIRNAIVLDRFVPLSTGGGKALFIGTYLPGDGINNRTKLSLLAQPDVRRYLQRSRRGEGVGFSDVTMDEILEYVVAREQGPDFKGDTDQGLASLGREQLRDNLTEHPGLFTEMVATKVWYAWRKGPLRTMAATGWVVFHRAIVVLALVGIGILAWRRRWEALVFLSLIGGVTLVAALLLTHPRRTLPLIPVLAALAAAAVVWAAEMIRERRVSANEGTA